MRVQNVPAATGRKISELEDPAGSQAKANAAEAAAIAEIGTRGLDGDGDFSGTIDGESAVDMKTKLTGIETGADVTSTHVAVGITGQGALATKNSVNLATTEVTNKNLDNIADTATYKRMLAAEQTKLAGIEEGADVTPADVFLKSTDTLDDVPEGTS